MSNEMPAALWIYEAMGEDYMPYFQGCSCEHPEDHGYTKYVRADRTIQSPDQGAVEAAMAALDGYSPDSDEQVSIGIKHLYALTRPLLDLAAERRGGGMQPTCSRSALRDEGWNACLDHLQAIRPDLFGGK